MVQCAAKAALSLASNVSNSKEWTTAVAPTTASGSFKRVRRRKAMASVSINSSSKMVVTADRSSCVFANSSGDNA